MAHHTIQSNGAQSNFVAISDQAAPFANGDTINTNGKLVLLDMHNSIIGAYGSDGPDGFGLNNSVYQPANGDVEVAPGVRIECRGNVNLRNIKFRGGDNSTFEVNTAVGETRTFSIGGAETGVFVESLATDILTRFALIHAGDGVGMFNGLNGANFIGRFGNFSGWGDGSTNITFSIENSAARQFVFSDWYFSNKAPLRFTYTGLEGLSPVNVNRCYFERSDDPGHATEIALSWAGAQNSVTQSTTQLRNWSDCTVNGIAEIYFPGGYTLENWVVRDLRMASASDTNAASMDGLIMLAQTTSITAMCGINEGFMFSHEENAHGVATNRLRAPIVFRNFWFQFGVTAGQTNDHGDAVLLNADNSLNDYLVSVQIDLENSGFMLDDLGDDLGSVALTLNGNGEAGGGDLVHEPTYNMRHCVVDLNFGANAINADEKGPTPPGMLHDITNNIFWSSRGDGGYVLQTFNDVNPNTDIADGVVDYNARFGLTNAYEGNYTTAPGPNDIVGVDPNFVRPAARIETFDGEAEQGGPGTYANVVAEFLKSNTVNANPSYTVTRLCQYFQDSYTAQATAYQTASDIGGLIGPTLGGGGVTIISVNNGQPIHHLQIGVVIKVSDPVEAGTFNAVRGIGPDDNEVVLGVTQVDGTTFLMDYDKGNTNLGFTPGGLELIRQ